MFHTPTPPSGDKSWGPDCEVKMRMKREMKMRWKWRWNESYLTGTRDGERKKGRGGAKREHQHQHTLPGTGEPWKGKGKEKAEADGRTPRQAEGGEGRTRLNQPNPSENKTYLSTHGTRPTYLERGSTHEIGDPWGPSWLKTKPTNRDSVPKCKVRALLPLRERSRSTQIGHKQLTSSLIRCTTCWPHQKIPKRPYLQEKDMPGASSHDACWLTESVSWATMKERRFSTAVSYALRIKNEARDCGKLFNTSIDRWNPKKADCFPLLIRIPGLKCVNSDVRSVNSLPKRGSLQWVHGTMSEPPWKSH